MIALDNIFIDYSIMENAISSKQWEKTWQLFQKSI